MKRVIINTESVNRTGYRILNAGARLGDYEKNPVLLYGHDREAMPIGTLTELKLEGGKLTGLPVFDMDDARAAQVAAKWEKNILNAASMGINVLKTSDSKTLLMPGQTRSTVTEWELLEVSIVDIPRNQECVKLAHADTEAQLDVVVPAIQLFKQPTIVMELTKTTKALGLAPDATDEAIAASIEVLKSERTNALLAFGTARGAVTDANKAQFEKLANADYSTTLALIETAKPATVETVAQPPVTVGELLKAVTDANAESATTKADAAPNSRASWSFDDYQRKDPDALLTMKREKPDEYMQLVKAYNV